jgi:hypothetical protein
MARAVSWNWELQFDGRTIGIEPLEIGEFGEGEEGRIEVADGSRKYKIRDQIFSVDEIPITILVKKDWWQDGSDYKLLNDWVLSGDAKQDVYLVARDAHKPLGNEAMAFWLQDCELAMGKLSAFNRKSKDELKKKFNLVPWDVTIVSGTHLPA